MRVLITFLTIQIYFILGGRRVHVRRRPCRKETHSMGVRRRIAGVAASLMVVTLRYDYGREDAKWAHVVMANRSNPPRQAPPEKV